MMNNRLFIAKRAAAYFRPGDVVNLGIGIPSMCSDYADPGVLFQTENGFIGVGPVAKGLMINQGYVNAGGVPYVPVPGGCGFDVAMSFGIIRSGRMAATVLGGLQVSAQGDLANWATPNQCSFPLTGVKCVDHVVTERCVIDVTAGGLVLSEIRRGHTVEEIQAAVEPELIVSPDLKEMEED